MSYTQDNKKEILEAAKFLKEQNFREETNFSLYATAEQMVRWHEKQANEGKQPDCNCNIQHVSQRSEQLIAFFDKVLKGRNERKAITADDLLKIYLEAINCG